MADGKDKADKVLIIGGGPGGLTLAQILHQNRVPFEIFERDKDLDHSRKGWAVALMECADTYLSKKPLGFQKSAIES